VRGRLEELHRLEHLVVDAALHNVEDDLLVCCVCTQIHTLDAALHNVEDDLLVCCVCTQIHTLDAALHNVQDDLLV
jgi:hypothetical protein